jgi:hypothetical protein
MMSAGQPINDELEARQVRFDLQVHREPALNSARATAGWDGKLESLGSIDQTTTTPKAASARSHEIKIDEPHRLFASTTSRYGQGIRAGLIVGALVASSGLAWIVISGLPSPFGLAWVGGSNGDRIPDPNAASSSLPGQSPTSSARIPDPKNETDREANAEAPDSPKLSSSSASIPWRCSNNSIRKQRFDGRAATYNLDRTQGEASADSGETRSDAGDETDNH